MCVCSPWLLMQRNMRSVGSSVMVYTFTHDYQNCFRPQNHATATQYSESLHNSDVNNNS